MSWGGGGGGGGGLMLIMKGYSFLQTLDWVVVRGD